MRSATERFGVTVLAVLLSTLVFIGNRTAEGASGSDGCVSAGALRAASRAGMTQSSSSNSNGGNPSFSYSGGSKSGGGGSSGGKGGSGSTVTLTGNQVESLYKSGVFKSSVNPFANYSMLSATNKSAMKSVLSAGQINILPSLKSDYSNVFYGKFNTKGDVLLTNVGKTPWDSLKLAGDGAFGKLYKDSATGSLYGQNDQGGVWHTVDANGDWGEEVRVVPGMNELVPGKMVTNKDARSAEGTYEAVTYDAEKNLIAVYEVDPRETNLTKVTLVGVGKTTDNGLFVNQIDSFGEATGNGFEILGALDADNIAGQVSRYTSDLGRIKMVYSKVNDNGEINGARLYINRDGSYNLDFGNGLGPKGSSLSYFEYSARREIAVALSENGFPVESSIASIINTQPGKALGRTGTLGEKYLFTDQYTGKQFALDLNKAVWYEQDLDGSYHELK